MSHAHIIGWIIFIVIVIVACFATWMASKYPTPTSVKCGIPGCPECEKPGVAVKAPTSTPKVATKVAPLKVAMKKPAPKIVRKTTGAKKAVKGK